jgi:HNH endonuclease
VAISYLNEQPYEGDNGVRGTGFYESKKWQKVRDAIRKRDKMTCRSCGQPIIGRSIVDHIERLTLDNMYDWDIAYNPENLQLLCIQCHNRKTFRKTMTPNETLW